MPQITVNEIDQSVVTRVVSDDRVKILIPAILSFGPGYDGETSSVMTCTDLSDFNRGCGYTPAEFNPFENDYSRIYARELMKKGSAVSVVRINNDGNTADFDIDGTSTNRELPSYNTICKAVMHSIDSSDKVKVENDTKTIGATIATTTNIIPQTLKLTVGNSVYIDDGEGNIVQRGSTSNKFGTINYSSGLITVTDTTLSGTAVLSYEYIKPNVFWKYTFCPQIAKIEAKYPGSFGNNLFISISQINSSRVSESYQYANISVYYINRNINYKFDETTSSAKIASQTVNSVTLLENKTVSTNPNDPSYFEDVEFEFIKIVPTPDAKQQLLLVWSDITAAPQTSNQYSGFPTIQLKYTSNTGVSSYNFDASFGVKTYGTDFNYSDDVIDKLKLGFKGYISGDGSSNWNQNDVNNYLKDVYGFGGQPGIYSNTMSNLSSMYQNYTDPYIYDFDFITSGGFVYEEYALAEGTDVSGETLTFSGTPASATLANHPVLPETLIISGKSGANDVTFYSKASSTSGTDDIVYVNGSLEVTVASIVLATGVITMDSEATGITLSTATYKYTATSEDDKVYKPELIYPGAGGYNSINPIHAGMLNLVETRQDCIALFDVPADYDKKLIVDYSRILNTSYGTMHFPWCWVADPDVQGNMLLMAPSYIFMYTFLSNLDNNVDSQKWFPPAGVKRATARVVKKPYFEIGSVILNDWQNDNTARVNPIMKLKQYGYVIYGQYTCLPAIDMFTHSALESLNVRLIANVVKKKIFDVCLNLAFEPNTSVLWLKFFAQMDEFLRYMQYNEGVYAYKIVMDESTVTTDDINHLRCPGKVYIAPTRTAEFFDIDFIITEAGALFNN